MLDIVPAGVALAESRDDRGKPLSLPAEAVALGRASVKRHRVFAVGRTCAREALAKLGVACAPILIGDGREPLWPAGIVGSITHRMGYCAAAVARREEVAAIGIDAEVHDRLTRGVVERVTCQEERDWIAACPDATIHWARVVFSAKESIFKAWFAITGNWLGFNDVVVTVTPPSGTFTARMLTDGPQIIHRQMSVDGRFAVEERLVLTSATIRPAS
jgi:4'-phosphopantetheinyl transferase EntD